MSKKINYPIKYAVLELKEKGGWLVGYEDITQGFIVSKCYVVESNIIYNADGSYKITHKVVFPFTDIASLRISLMNGCQNNIGEKNIPSYDACNKPYPINEVADLFDSYEEAKIIADEKNEGLKHNLILKVSISDSNWKEKYETLKSEFNQRLKLCNFFEQLVLEATERMELSEQLTSEKQEPFVRILKPIKK